MWNVSSSPISRSAREGRTRLPSRQRRDLTTRTSALLQRGSQRRGHHSRQPLPSGCFFAETLSASRGQLVVLGLSVVVRDAPLGIEQTLTLEPIQGRVQRTLLDLQRAAGHLANAQQHT